MKKLLGNDTTIGLFAAFIVFIVLLIESHLRTPTVNCVMPMNDGKKCSCVIIQTNGPYWSGNCEVIE